MNRIPVVLDLSHHNAIVGDYGALVAKFRQLKAVGIVGIIHKATESTANKDGRYAVRRMAAKEVGLLWGAFHFLHKGNVATQVKHFLDTAQPDASTLVALDHEGDASLSDVRAFLDAVAATLGRKPVLYSGHTIKGQLGKRVDPYFGSHRLWHAQYGTKAVTQASWPDGPWLWQYNDKGNIAGLSPVDVNAFPGTVEQLRAEWSGRSVPLPDPIPDPTPPPPDIESPEVRIVPRSFSEWLVDFLRALFGKR